MEKYHLSIEKLIENCTLGPKDNLFKVLHGCPRFLYDISTGIIKSVSHMILMALIFEFIAPMCYFVMFDVGFPSTMSSILDFLWKSSSEPFSSRLKSCFSVIK